MIRSLPAAELWTNARLGHGFTRDGCPSTAVLGDFLRSSLAADYDYGSSEHPVSIHSILGRTVERLSSAFSIQSSLQTRMFGDEGDEDLSRVGLREVLDWLVDIGDVISVGDGGYYPARTRCVALPAGGFALVSGSATDALSRELGIPFLREIFGRFLEAAPEGPFPPQSFMDWLDLPQSGLIAWTNEAYARPLNPMVTEASAWQVARFEPRVHFGPPTPADCGSLPVIAREKRERLPGYNRYIVRLRREGSGYITTAARELTFHECSRLMAGQALKRGKPFEIGAILKNGAELVVTTTVYQLPEVKTLLTYFSTHREAISDAKIAFTIPASCSKQLAANLVALGVKLRTGKV